MRLKNSTLLLWLPVALTYFAFALSGKEADSSGGGSAQVPHHIREALSSQALDLIHEHGQNIDVSLEGYDHELIAQTLDQGSSELRKDDRFGLGFANAPQKLGQMREKPYSVKEEQEGKHLKERGDALAQEELAAREKMGDGVEVDYSLEGYDHDLVMWEAE